ncbi:MAG: hypothetical protein U9R74_07735 [Pseudomonadota bacterium]|nr:hypothetical protein [Pseudomonadota bacterium]
MGIDPRGAAIRNNALDRNLRFYGTLLALGLTLYSAGALAIAQRVGDFELAVDAPWRMEPRAAGLIVCDDTIVGCGASTSYQFGEIPIVVSIHDADFPDSDDARRLQKLIELRQSGRSLGSIAFALVKDVIPVATGSPTALFADLVDGELIDSDLLEQYPTTRLTGFVSLTVSEHRGGVYEPRRIFRIDDLHEVERTMGFWRWSAEQTGPEAAGVPPSRPTHQLCRAWDGDDCRPLASLGGTSEWHATAFYQPAFGDQPGREVRLKVDLKLIARVDGQLKPKTYTQYLSVHLGEAPLPKFDDRWVYGDLHYHSQGTDNDGESAYAYRGALHAMSALGLDFAFATDHASNSRQIVSARPKSTPELVAPVFRGLRDLSPDRFAFGIELLNGPRGANREVISYPRRAPVEGPLGIDAGLVAPQLFLGAEVDVIPEFEAGKLAGYDFFGACGALPYAIKALHQATPLPSGYVCGDMLDTTPDGRQLIRDPQGPANGRLVSSSFYARQHLLHLPEDPNRTNAFIPSNTSKYGGATRRLGEILDLELDQRGKGYAFLAHPIARSSGNEPGRLGPDLVPYTEAQLRDAFASPYVLGLQIWNGNGQQHSKMKVGDARDYLGKLVPVNDLAGWRHGKQKHGLATEFGARLWDRMLLWGIDAQTTANLSWLVRGEPRRVLMAGGSDAHGDLNYRREGYFLGTESITDTAMGTPRNLLFTGEPEGEVIAGSGGTAKPLSQAQIVAALRSGNFAVTDGPALRIAYDVNRNGIIDDDDAGMGSSTVQQSQCSFSLLLEWKSTPEFGRVERVDVYLGVSADGIGEGFVYQPWRAPFGRNDIDPSTIGGSSIWVDAATGKRYVRTPDHQYWYDPTRETLVIDVSPSEGFEGRRLLRLDPADFPVGTARPICNTATTSATLSLARTSVPTALTSGTLSTKPMAVRLPAQNLRPQVGGGVIGGTGPIGPIQPPPPRCEIEGSFEGSTVPERLFIRAVATSRVAPGTAQDCAPSASPPQGDKRPQCIQRRAYSNPLWVTLQPDARAQCFRGEQTPEKSAIQGRLDGTDRKTLGRASRKESISPFGKSG